MKQFLSDTLSVCPRNPACTAVSFQPDTNSLSKMQSTSSTPLSKRFRSRIILVGSHTCQRTLCRQNWNWTARRPVGAAFGKLRLQNQRLVRSDFIRALVFKLLRHASRVCQIPRLLSTGDGTAAARNRYLRCARSLSLTCVVFCCQTYKSSRPLSGNKHSGIADPMYSSAISDDVIARLEEFMGLGNAAPDRAARRITMAVYTDGSVTARNWHLRIAGAHGRSRRDGVTTTRTAYMWRNGTGDIPHVPSTVKETLSLTNPVNCHQ
jgi:hypothetical protein